MTAANVIRTDAVTKHFGATKALDNISIEVPQGEVYGFIGLNGAGKTTLIRILLGMIWPDGGNVSLYGKQLTRSFDRWNDVGYLVETPHSYPNLTVRDNLRIFYHLRKLTEPKLLDTIIEKLKLNAYASVKAGHLSLGNQQRLGIAKALMHRPKLIILDEPINGLDPEGIVEVRELLKELAANGSTIFLSSHILGEMSKVADRLAIIHQGKLRTELTQAELSQRLIRKIVVSTLDNSQALSHLKDAEILGSLSEDGEIEIMDEELISRPETVTQLLTEKGLPPKLLFTFTEDLEKFFLRTIKN
ncbi:MAG: ATP-binding cassette domain-containing protein [Flavobacteriales bacterium]|nr:ATP-binding cassette domain-containing protein [Flavobacteriales bacterium]